MCICKCISPSPVCNKRTESSIYRFARPSAVRACGDLLTYQKPAEGRTSPDFQYGSVEEASLHATCRFGGRPILVLAVSADFPITGPKRADRSLKSSRSATASCHCWPRSQAAMPAPRVTSVHVANSPPQC